MRIRVKTGVWISCQVMGQGPPLLLLHGNGEDHRIFQEAARELAQDFTLYLPDSRCHGASQKTAQIGYREMAADMISLVEKLGMVKPLICGFSDGGITALLMTAARPSLPSGLILCGANATPRGLKARCRLFFRIQWWKDREPLVGMMFREPRISRAMLANISVPVLVLAGSRDLIRRSHTTALAQAIPNSRLRILAGETHDSYVVHSRKLCPWIRGFWRQLVRMRLAT